MLPAGPRSSNAVLDSQSAALALVGLRADDVFGARLGRVSAVLVDRENGAVQWLQVRLVGIHVVHLAIPVHDLVAGGGHLHLPYERSHLMQAPRVPDSGVLTSRLERQLHAFWGGDAPTTGSQLTVWERRATSSRLVAPGDWTPAPRGDSDPSMREPLAPERPTGSTKPAGRTSVLGARPPATSIWVPEFVTTSAEVRGVV